MSQPAVTTGCTKLASTFNCAGGGTGPIGHPPLPVTGSPTVPEADMGATRQPASSRTGLAGRALLGLLFALVVGASAWLLSPVFDPRRLPGDEALGRPAPFTVKAARDYEIPAVEATSRRREEAAASELPVYDHDWDAVGEAAARIRGAFQLMRAADARWRARAGPGPVDREQLEQRARILAAARGAL